MVFKPSAFRFLTTSVNYRRQKDTKLSPKRDDFFHQNETIFSPQRDDSHIDGQTLGRKKKVVAGTSRCVATEQRRKRAQPQDGAPSRRRYRCGRGARGGLQTPAPFETD